MSAGGSILSAGSFLPGAGCPVQPAGIYFPDIERGDQTGFRPVLGPSGPRAARSIIGETSLGRLARPLLLPPRCLPREFVAHPSGEMKITCIAPTRLGRESLWARPAPGRPAVRRMRRSVVGHAPVLMRHPSAGTRCVRAYPPNATDQARHVFGDTMHHRVTKKKVVQGLCSTCNNAPTCGYLKRRGFHAIQCELFDDYTPPESISPPAIQPAAPPPPQVSNVSVQEKGLCVNCETRETCRYPRPSGGVWHCEEYR
jgi:hypothetical protein